MMPTKPWCQFVAFLLALLSASTPVRAEDVSVPDPSVAPPDAALNERVLSIAGDAQRPVTLQVTVLTPSGPGPFPLAVMNHGASGTQNPALMPRYRLTFSAYYFLSRGYAVVLPMMRGFAGSGGKVETHGCDLESVGIDNAKDIAAVISYMVTQPNIDGSGIIVAGQSFGGWNTLALGTLDLPMVKGLVNFAGGATVSSCASWEASLAVAAEHFGGRTKIPSIWFYGDNDTIFSPPTWHTMYDRYTAAGGKAELVAYGSFMADSHQLLSYPEGLKIWASKVDAFLTGIGLPSKLTHPEYLPQTPPPPSHYAAVDDVEAVPYLTDQGRQLYLKFLNKPMPRAIVITSNGSVYSYSSGFDPFGTASTACKKEHADCQPYAVDNDVVWSRPTPAPPATHFAALDDSSAVPYLNELSRRGYQRFLTLKRPRAFVIAPDGSWNVAAGGDPIARAMESCTKAHKGCQLYAIDNDVVWPEK